MSVSQINRIIKAVKEGKTTADLRHTNPKKTRRTNDAVASIAAVEKNRRITVRELAAVHGLTFGTVQAILTDDLGLVKKSARWVPKLLSSDQKQREWIAATPFWTSFGGSHWRS